MKRANRLVLLLLAAVSGVAAVVRLVGNSGGRLDSAAMFGGIALLACGLLARRLSRLQRSLVACSGILFALSLFFFVTRIRG
jgi:hypothetical protein